MITQHQTQQQFGFVNGQFDAHRELSGQSAGDATGRSRMSLESGWDDYAAMVTTERPDLATVALLGYN